MNKNRILYALAIAAVVALAVMAIALVVYNIAHPDAPICLVYCM